MNMFMITIYDVPCAFYIGAFFYLYVRTCVCVLPRETTVLPFYPQDEESSPIDCKQYGNYIT